MSKKSVKSYAIGENLGTADAQSVVQNFFGAGYIAEARAGADEGEKILSVNMRLLAKSSVTTKQKALSEIVKAIPITSDEVVAGFLYNYIDVVGKHIFHENPQLRSAIYRTLETFIANAGKETKRQVAQNLGNYMSYVLFGMHDPDPQVAKSAHSAFVNCFPEPEKRAVALARSFQEVSTFVSSQLEAAFSKVTAIKNDDEEPEAFAIIMAFGTVSYLLAHHPTPSESQPFALSLLKGKDGYLRRCLPSDPARPAKLVASAPKVRASAFALLSSLIAVTAPITTKDFGLVWTCCMQGITDPQPAVVFIAWQLSLKWIERFKKEAVESMPDGFVGLALTQIDNLSVHNSGSAFEALLSALLPLVAVISRDERHAGVVDDVCGTLVEKVKIFSARPSSREYELIWTTLLECWDLHLLRKSVRNETAHSLELLAVMLAVLVEQAAGATPANSGRLWDALEGTAAPLVAKYLLKAVQRPESMEHASEVLFTVLDEAKRFKVIAHPKDKIILLRFATFVGSHWLKRKEWITKDPVREVIVQWLNTLIEKLLGVCEEAAADGEEDTSAKQIVSYTCIGHLVKALATSGAYEPSTPPIYIISEELQNRIVAAASPWADFPTKLAPYLFKAECLKQHSSHVVDTDASTPSTGNPSIATTSKTARALLDRIEGAGFAEASDSDIKVLSVAIDNDNIAPDEMLALFTRVAAHGRYIDCAASLLKALARNQPDGGLRAHAATICDAIREAITTLWETEAGSREGPRTSSSLVYDNEAPSASDSDESSSGSSSDDDSDATSSSGSSSSKDSKLVSNAADDVRIGLVEWMSIIGDESFSRYVLPEATAGDQKAAAARRELVLPIISTIFWGITSISPLLHIEQFVSLRFLRSAMSRVEAALESQTFLYSVFRKRSFLKAASFDELLALFSSTCEDDLGLEEKDVRAVVVGFFDQYIFSNANWADQKSGTSHLEALLHVAATPTELVSGQHLLKIASPYLNPKRGDPSADVIGLHQIAGLDALAAVLRLGQLAVAVAKDAAARTELLQQRPLDSGRVASMVVALTAVLALRLTLSDGAIKAARDALRAIFSVIPLHGTFTNQSEEAIAHQVWRTCMPALAQHALLPCFAEEVGIFAASVGPTEFSRRSIISAASDWYVTSPKEQQVLYAEAFQSLLDRSGVLNTEKDRSIVLLPNTEAAINTALKAPTTSFPVAVAYLMVLRGCQSAPVISDDTITTLGMRTQKPDDEVKALALISELLCANNSNASLYTELCRMATQSATKNYSLSQFPSNGKLGQRLPTAVPPPLEVLQPTIMALAKASKGMVLHRKRDDVLRSTINLVIFDAVCDAISRLRSASTAALAPPTASSVAASPAALSAASIVGSRNTSLAVLVSFVAKAYRHISTLQAGDIASIGASEHSVGVISNALASVHMWICGSTVAQLEAIGVNNVLEVLSCVNTLALVSLNQSPAPIASVVHLIRKKLLVKGARVLHVEGEEVSGDKLTTAKVVKMPHFKKLFTSIEKTTKQKLSLFTWLTAWACTFTNKRFSLEEVPRSDIVQLLDIAMSLLLCPYTAHDGKGRVDNTFLYLSADQFLPEDTGFAFRPQALGKLQQAAAMPTAKRMGQELMGVLARGAASVLSLAIQSAALPVVRDWLETIDPSVRSRLLSFAEEHLCPILIQTSLVGVLSHSPNGTPSFELEDGYTVKIDMERRWISLSFTFEDVTSSMDITLPKTYPLVISPDMVKPTFQSSGKHAVQLRTWCMKMSMTLFNGESNSLWDAVEMFGQNMKSYLEGVEPCPICYCVLSTKKTVPDMACSVCHNKCHKICLNKWWSSTGNCSCPYCRSPWVV